MSIRHRHPRAQLPALAVLILPGERWIGPFVIENLSEGGALAIAKHAPFISHLARSTLVRAQLHIPGLNRVIETEARIVRVTEGSPATDPFVFALEFQRTLADDLSLLRRAVLETIEAARAKSEPLVMILDASEEDGRALQEIVRGLGRRVKLASNLVDAIRLLQHQSLRFDVALLDVSALARDGTSFDALVFLSEHFPDVRLVVTSRDLDAPELRIARASPHCVGALLKPPQPNDVAIAIGLASA